MIKNFLSRFNKKNSDSNDSKASFDTVGECPICGSSVLQEGNHWTCRGVLSGSCNFTISRYTEDGKKITMDMIHMYDLFFNDTSMKKFMQSAFEAANTNETTNESQQNQSTTSAIVVEEKRVVETIQQPVVVEEQPVVIEEQPVAAKEQVIIVEEQPVVIEEQSVPKEQPVTTNQNKPAVNNSQQKVNNQEPVENQKPTQQQDGQSSQERGEIFLRNRRLLKYPCSCGGKVYRYGNWAECSNCDFKIYTKYRDKSFSDDEMAQLIGRRISGYITVIEKCKNGRPLNGRVFLDFDKDGNLIPQYKFVNSPYNVNGHYREMLFAPDEGKIIEIPFSKKFPIKSSNSSNNNSDVSSNNSGSNNSGFNNSYNNYTKKTNNVSGDGTHVKFDPFKSQNTANSRKDMYKAYLEIDDDSEPF